MNFQVSATGFLLLQFKCLLISTLTDFILALECLTNSHVSLSSALNAKFIVSFLSFIFQHTGHIGSGEVQLSVDVS